MKYEHLLFDLDNTILDFTSAMIFAFKKTIATHGIPEDENHLKIYQKINKKYWAEMEKGRISQSELRWMRMKRFLQEVEADVEPIKFTEDYHTNLSDKIFWLDNSKELLDRWSKNFELTLVTNGFKDIQRPRIKKAGLDAIFKTIIISDEIGVSKPEKGFFDYTFEKLNNPEKEKTLIIGDNLGSDIRGGKNYGIDTCWLNKHEQNFATRKNRPTFSVKKLEELELHF